MNAAVQIEITKALVALSPPMDTTAYLSVLMAQDSPSAWARCPSPPCARMAWSDGGGQSCGTSWHVECNSSVCRLQGAVEGFDLTKLSRAPARFDEAEPNQLNAKLLPCCHGKQ